MLELTHLEDQFLTLTSYTDDIDNAALRRLMGGLAWFTQKEPSNVLPLVDISTYVDTWFGDAYKKVCSESSDTDIPGMKVVEHIYPRAEPHPGS
ncbi:MAG: hypothetical protein DMG35_04905 [Acidobacteria bacterium]|nr:MAG: hypothetical protein AUH86_24305 [Acidobacteria bacterium 13_1_40CM_4_58_4]PYT63213.1 MAG: hypothetical protein DMG35_04905 [Acidobacteriota bacterium]